MHRRSRIAILPTSLLALVCGTGVTAAQNAVTTLPHSVRDAGGASLEVMPLGRTKCFLQTWYRGEGMVPGQVVTSIGWRAEVGVTTGSGTLALEVVLDNNARSMAGLSSTFAQNLTAPTTFFALRSISFPRSTGSQFNQPSVWIPGDVPFVYSGPHLLVQVDNRTSASPGGFNYPVDGIDMRSSTFKTHYTRQACGATHHSVYSRGRWQLDITGAAPNTPAALLFGVDNHRFAGAGLPFDLSGLGLAGCRLELAPLVVLNTVADASGNVALRFNYAHSGDSRIVFSQGVHFDAANPGRLVTTRAAASHFGQTGYAARLFNLSVFGPTAEFGPDTTDRAAVLLLR